MRAGTEGTVVCEASIGSHGTGGRFEMRRTRRRASRPVGRRGATAETGSRAPGNGALIATPMLAVAALSGAAGPASTPLPPDRRGPLDADHAAAHLADQAGVRVARGALAADDATVRFAEERRFAEGRRFAERSRGVLAALPAPDRAGVPGAAHRVSRGTRRPVRAQYVKPVDHYALSSGFGLRWGRLHAGLDLAVPVGTPVRATAAGEVIQAGWEGGYGRLVQIRHRDGVITAYAHLSTVTVRPGVRVGAGDVIGRVGSTGRSTGPHLHFEVRTPEAVANPLSWLRGHGLAM